MFACLPGLTLHNSHIRHSRFSSGCDPETGWLCNAAQCSYYDTVLVAAHVHRSQPWCQNRPRRHKRGALLNETKGAVYSKLQPPSQANERSWGRRGSAADFQTAIPAPLASMSMGIRVTSLKFSVHYIGLSCSFVSAQYRTTQFNHSMAISWLHKLKWSRYLIKKKEKSNQNQPLVVFKCLAESLFNCLYCRSDTSNTSAMYLSVRVAFIFTDYKEYLR